MTGRVRLAAFLFGVAVSVSTVWHVPHAALGQAIGAKEQSGLAAVETKLTASDGAADDEFGRSVAISGDTMVVGVPRDNVTGVNSGSAYVFARSRAVWTQQAKLTASDAAGFDAFGGSVAISGDTVVVGASRADVGTRNIGGAAYIFARDGATWTQQAKLTAGDAAEDDEFGGSVAISGDTVVVGAFRRLFLGGRLPSFTGAAYIFTRSGASWTQQAKLTASDAAIEDGFGDSVAISGDTVLIGASGDDDVARNSGAAYIFTRGGAAWTQQAKLTAGDAAEFDFFGVSVAISGDTVVIGATGDDDAGRDSGAAYVFARGGAAWTEQAKLTAGDAAEFDIFGVSVAISGDTVVIGAEGDDDPGDRSGAAYIFARSGARWTQQAKLTAGDASEGDEFGGSVAISGDTVVIGAVGDDSFSGSAYVFELGTPPPSIPEAPHSTFDPATATLHIPSLEVLGRGEVYAVDFTLVPGSEPPAFDLAGARLLDDPAPASSAAFDPATGTLNISAVEVPGLFGSVQIYVAELVTVPFTSPPRVALVHATLAP